jgi:hypothetical protein
MRWLLILGVVLVLAGVGGLVVDVIPIHHQEEVAKIGPLTATQDKETDVVIPPYVALFTAVIGAGFVFVGARQRA